MIKFKKLLEGFAWERKPGQPLPTMEDVARKYKMKEAAPRMRKDSYVENLKPIYRELSKLDNQMKAADSSRYSHVKNDFHKALKGIDNLASKLRVKGATIPN